MPETAAGKEQPEPVPHKNRQSKSINPENKTLILN